MTMGIKLIANDEKGEFLKTIKKKNGRMKIKEGGGGSIKGTRGQPHEELREATISYHSYRICAIQFHSIFRNRPLSRNRAK